MAHIHRAARLGNSQEVLASLAQGENVDAVSIHHFTPLMLAAREGHLRTVTLLLDKGANVNLAHPNGRTALHLASSAGHEKIVQALLLGGANINIVSKRGDSPAIEAAHFNRIGGIEILRSYQADMSHCDKQGRTADDWLSLGGMPGHFKKTFSVSLEQRANRGDRGRFEQALAKVGAIPPDEQDQS
jgi:ankyrin repeat protein